MTTPKQPTTARDYFLPTPGWALRNKLASEATAYNSLVIAWPEISQLTRREPTPSVSQTAFFDQQEAEN